MHFVHKLFAKCCISQKTCESVSRPASAVSLVIEGAKLSEIRGHSTTASEKISIGPGPLAVTGLYETCQ